MSKLAATQTERRQRIGELLREIKQDKRDWGRLIATHALTGTPAVSWNQFRRMKKLERQNEARVNLGLEPLQVLVSECILVQLPPLNLSYLCPSYVAATVAAMERLEGTTMLP